MNLIARWTIGPVTPSGLDILKKSVFNFARIYPEFQRVICHNHVSIESLGSLKNSIFYKQNASCVPCKLLSPDNNMEEATGCGWKLAPPRLNINAMELFIDNDIIIHKRLPEIDEWLNRKTCGLLAEGLKRKRMYGVFDAFVPQGINANAGLFGLPSGFDFNKQIFEYSQFLTGGLGGYNEQGLTVATIVNMKDYIMVPLSTLYISEDHVEFPDNIPDAVHFVGVNRKNWHRGWKAYKEKLNKIEMI